MTTNFQACETRVDADRAVAGRVEAHLSQALSASSGRIGLLLSGGTTPAAAYRMLSEAKFDWSRIDVGLVDDRWVAETHAASNARLVRESLLQGPAEAANFIGMKTNAETSSRAVEEVNRHYQPFTTPTCVVLGMGPDGHTASWFPGSAGLEDAMSTNTLRTVTSINAEGCPVAGDLTDRMTITLPVLLRASHVIIYITGEEKRRVFENAAAGLPVHTLLTNRSTKMEVIWAP